MQASYAHEQTNRAYKDFVGQFDSLMDTNVRWTPYSKEAIATRAPQGLSSLCFRDQQYWMMRTPVLFDMYVEEYAIHRVLRQFGLYQESPLCVVHAVPHTSHR
jgi:hypothetical protein